MGWELPSLFWDVEKKKEKKEKKKRGVGWGGRQISPKYSAPVPIDLFQEIVQNLITDFCWTRKGFSVNIKQSQENRWRSDWKGAYQN